MRTSALCVALSALSSAGQAVAQCYSFDQPDPSPGLDAGPQSFLTDAALWDPDGPGPLPAVVAVCGTFGGAGGVPATNVAVWDGESWRRLGPLQRVGADARTIAAGPDGELIIGGNRVVGSSGLARWTGSDWVEITTPGEVNQARYSPRGDLIITGNFSSVDNVQARSIARRIDGQWRPISSGLSGSGSCIAVASNGQIFVGGQFTGAGGAATRNIALWDAAEWRQPGGGLDGPVSALLARADGSIIAAGTFTASGGTPLANIARWNGSVWAPLGPGLPSPAGGVRALSGRTGDIIAGGDFAPASGPRRVARWDGAAWTDISRGMNAGVRSLLSTPTGTLAVGSFTQADSWPAFKIARWTGEAWLPTSTRTYASAIDALAVRGNDLFGAGPFYARSIQGENRLAVRRGDAWSILTTPTNGQVLCILPMPDGSLIAGGSFTRAGSTSATRIARWDGSAWMPLGAGTDGAVRRLALLPTGEVIAAGDFLHAGGVSAAHIASWDGRAWAPLAAGRPEVTDMIVLPDGDLLATPGAAGQPLARWDGHAWSGMPAPFAARALTLDALGDLYIAGSQTRSIARLRDGVWATGGPELTTSATAIAPFPGGGVLTADFIGGFLRHRDLFGVPVNTEGASLFTTLAALPDGSFGVVRTGGFQMLRPDGGGAADPVFTVEPPDVPVFACPGTHVSLEVRAESTRQVTYQWYLSSSRSALGLPVGTTPRVTVTAPSGYRGVVYLRCIAAAGPCTSTQSRIYTLVSALADVNGDGFVDGFDLEAFITAFEAGGTAADFNRDGFVDFLDYLDFIDAFEHGC